MYNFEFILLYIFKYFYILFYSEVLESIFKKLLEKAAAFYRLVLIRKPSKELIKKE